MKPTVDIGRMCELQRRPPPFEPGEALFWDDPWISTQMLKAHLDPNNDAASRKPETIASTVRWLMHMLDLKSGDALIDLGCGPGLYAAQFADQGLRVTGVDYSRRSIDYAIEQARQTGQTITYRYQNYLTLEDNGQYDAACLIYGDYCPLPPEARQTLLANIHRALKPGGRFVLDVTTPQHRRVNGARNGWYAVETGFWKPGPHLVLEEGFSYPEDDLYLDQYITLEPDGTISIYRNWFQDFTAERITQELEEGGFKAKGLWSDLTGKPLTESSEWIGVITERT